MPKVKPLIKPDPLEKDITAEIASGMALAGISIKELAAMTEINYSTLVTRIGKNGDIKSLRIGELIRIRSVLSKWR